MFSFCGGCRIRTYGPCYGPTVFKTAPSPPGHTTYMARREGFEPSHRQSQPNGLANRPLIASWVSPHIKNNNTLNLTIDVDLRPT